MRPLAKRRKFLHLIHKSLESRPLTTLGTHKFGWRRLGFHLLNEKPSPFVPPSSLRGADDSYFPLEDGSGAKASARKFLLSTVPALLHQEELCVSTPQ